MEHCICMSFDAMRIALGQKPKNFRAEEVIAWLGAMVRTGLR